MHRNDPTPAPDWLVKTASPDPAARTFSGELAPKSDRSRREVWQPLPLALEPTPVKTARSPKKSASGAAKRPLVFTEAEFAAALDAVSRNVQDQATLAEQAGRAALETRALICIAEALAAGEPAQQRLTDRAAMQLVEIFVEALQALRPGLDRSMLADALEQVLKSAMTEIGRAETVEIRIADSQIGALEPKLTRICRDAGINRPLTIIGDTELKAGQADVVWRHGRATLQTDAMMDAVLETLRSWLVDNADDECRIIGSAPMPERSDPDDAETEQLQPLSQPLEVP